ncbi:hypothetical protein U9M48_039153 [Paspalum notatum var. saurae]|uniref:Transposase n=1 Tax=Paspalum notatum var. saurae TaxID=547442 RepID=A0AAQ3XEB2_PASNO
MDDDDSNGHTINKDLRLMGVPGDDEEDLGEERDALRGLGSQGNLIDLAAGAGDGDGEGRGMVLVLTPTQVGLGAAVLVVAAPGKEHPHLRLDLPICIAESAAFEEYIRKAHNPRFTSVSRQTTTRDITKYFADHHAKLVESLRTNVSSVAITSDIWSGNAKEDYLSVVIHYVNSAWELEKRIIGLRLIDVSHSGENIAERVHAVVDEFKLTDKTFSVTSGNASANSTAMTILTPLLSGYVEKVLTFLEMFYNATCVLSGVYYPTSPLIMHHILQIANHLDAYENDPLLRTVVAPMKTKFLKYWRDIPLLYSFAFILDPRAKLKGFTRVLSILSNLSQTDYSGYLTYVRAQLSEVFNKYDSKFGAVRLQRAPQPSRAGKKRTNWGMIYGDDDDSIGTDVLTVHVSTISSESAFSLTGRIIEERRRRLNPEMVEMLTCIKDWEEGEARARHTAEDKELEDSFSNLFLDDVAQEAQPPSDPSPSAA